MTDNNLKLFCNENTAVRSLVSSLQQRLIQLVHFIPNDAGECTECSKGLSFWGISLQRKKKNGGMVTMVPCHSQNGKVPWNQWALKCKILEYDLL